MATKTLQILGSLNREEIKVMTSNEYLALTPEEKVSLYESGIRVIVVDSYDTGDSSDENVTVVGGYYTPSVDANGNLTWTASSIDMPSIAASNIKGPQGEIGPAGYSPVKGEDYWTTEDQQQIVDAVAAVAQSDWNETDETKISYILNKPDVATDEEIIDMMLSLDMMPVVQDADGSVLVDSDGAILMN